MSDNYFGKTGGNPCRVAPKAMPVPCNLSNFFAALEIQSNIDASVPARWYSEICARLALWPIGHS